MSDYPLLFMPFLHRELRPAALPSPLLQLWPGLPNPQQGFYIPPDLPLTPQDAARYVAHMQDISLAAADRVPAHSLLAAEKQMQRPDLLKERQDISAFAQGKEADAAAACPMKEAKIAAQKALLRVWLLEERHMEILELEQRCRTLSGDFSAALGVELEEEEKDALLLTQGLQGLDASAELSVSWRFVLENAALFLPEHSTLFFMDAAICSELRELALHCAQAHVNPDIFGHNPPVCAPEWGEAPLWTIFGMEGLRPDRPWLAKVFSFLLWDDAR